MCHAPQPHEPEVSEANCLWGRYGGGGRKDVPFQVRTKVNHHARSDLKLAFIWMGILPLGGRQVSCSRSSILRRKDLPACTTLHAWLSRPHKDSRSLWTHHLLVLQSWKRPASRWSLSCWRRCTVSILMPRKVRHVVGPSLLWGARGTPRQRHSLSSVSRESWHWVVFGAPRRMKSSR